MSVARVSVGEAEKQAWSPEEHHAGVGGRESKSSQTRPTPRDALSGRRDRRAEYPKPIHACVSNGQCRCPVYLPGDQARRVQHVSFVFPLTRRATRDPGA